MEWTFINLVMNIFLTYTGSALINNALMTIESLANLSSVTQITPETLLKLHEKLNLRELNKRLKSYTMLFSKNGPLRNDKKYGDAVYSELMNLIFCNYENEGNYCCEISGLRFQKTFKGLYLQALKNIGCPQKEIVKKDITVNRCWFPLIGGLGSDAQALPQAKFELHIHPICIAVLQFLPLSALLYKGGILLVDSIDFDFTKEFVKDNTKKVCERIELTKKNEAIENIKDYNKGHYLLKAIDILNEKQEYENESDLNLWSFSNSGTGASCNIERIPNDLISKLIVLRKNPACKNELESILYSNTDIVEKFLDALESNQDTWILYPQKEQSGVSVEFFDEYQRLIGNSVKTKMAKYVSGLLQKYIINGDKFDKLLSKTDAYQSSFEEYRTMLQTILLRATEKGDWNIHYHLEMLNAPNNRPVESSISLMYRMIHYYYQKNCSIAEFPVRFSVKQTKEVLQSIIYLIEKDVKKERIIDAIRNRREYRTVPLLNLFIRNAGEVEFPWITEMFFENNQEKKFGILDLLHIYYCQPQSNLQPLKSIEMFGMTPQSIIFKDFASDYTDYYFDKYKNEETGKFPYEKFKKHVLQYFPRGYIEFLRWFEEATTYMNDFFKKYDKTKIVDDSILYDKYGERIIGFAKFSIEFFLNKEYNNRKNNFKN